MSTLRKAFTVGLMLVTVLSMSVAVAPQAKASAQGGDLIKMNGLSSVYFLGNDGKRYVFPNESTYFSWFSDFSGVVTISQAELESYPLGANITVRPGTFLVKITTNPNVYAVESNGTLRLIPDEITAITLYGTNWAQRVVDMPDAFFTNYEIVDEPLDEDTYPEGTLIKMAGSPDVYYIAEDGTARKIASEAAFVGNMFNWNNVITTAAGYTLPILGDDITGAESALTYVPQGEGDADAPVINYGSGLSVALAGDTSASASIPSGASLVSFVTVNVTASNDGPVKVTNMTFTRKGTGLTTDFDAGYLYTGNTRLTNAKTVNSSTNQISFSAINLDIPAGQTKSVTLKLNADSAASGNHYFAIEKASDILTSGSSVSGAFPISGNTMSFSNSVDAGTLTFSANGNDYDRFVGETNVILGEFDIENDNKEDVNIFSIMLKQGGTASTDAVSNVSLELDGEVVLENIDMNDKYLDFSLDNPFRLEKSKKITAVVRGDVVTDINKTIELYLRNVADVDARGTAYGDFYNANVVINASFNALGAGAGADDVNIKGSKINVAFDGPAATEIKDDTRDLVLANFKISVDTDDVSIDKMPMTLTMGTANAAFNLDNIEMVDTTNNVSYSVSDPTAAATTHTLDFENISLNAGVNYNFQIRGDVPSGVTAGETYQASFNFAAITGATYTTSDDEPVVPAQDFSSTSLTGKVMTVANPAVIFSKVTTNDATYVKDADKVLLYKGKISANGVDDLRITKVKLATRLSTIATLNDAFDKLYLSKVNADGTETVLDDETSLAVTAASFSGFTLNIPKGISNGVYVTLRGDVNNSPVTGTVEFKWDNSATTTNFNVKDTDSDALTAAQYMIDNAYGQKTTLASKGEYTMVIDKDIAEVSNDKNVLAGNKVLVGRVKFTAQKEVAIVEDLVLSNLSTGTQAQTNDIASVKLFSDKLMSTELASADLDANGNATFDNVNINIPTSGATYVYVGVVVKAIDYSVGARADATATAARTLEMVIAQDTTIGGITYNTLVKGKDTGEELADPAYNAASKTAKSTILGANITAISSTFPNGKLSNGTIDVFGFTVTADSSTNVDYNSDKLAVRLDDITFTCAGIATTTGTGTVILSDIKVMRVGGSDGYVTAKNASNVATVYAGGTFVIDFINTFGDNIDGKIAPGETAEYLVRAKITDVSTGESMQVYIDQVNTDVKYTHNYATTKGTLAGQITSVSPLLQGKTVIGTGSLSENN